MTSDLFSKAQERRPKPLAAEIRPHTLDELIGQRHILGPNGPLRRRVQAGRLGTVILFGPPGVGKTTIARAIGQEMRKEFRSLHPASSNVSDIKAVAQEARAKDVLVFIDEIHRFSSAQQDYLLDLTETGTFDLIAATTGNPYHVLTPALVSRASIFQLEPHSLDDLKNVVERAVDFLAQQKGLDVRLDGEALKQLTGRAGGDARRVLNALETLVLGSPPGTTVPITGSMVDEVYQASPLPFDRKGDFHYDTISAFIKSMRGSDPDATLYWLARLIHSGEDPRFIARRILIHASEDVGLADNTALQTAAAALTAVQHVGYPEAQIVLAHAALHIARAPKSNSACRGIGAAMSYVKSQPMISVPPHLRDGHYAGAAKLGHIGYQFPHDDPRGWVDQTYAPGIRSGQFYQSDGRGGHTFEARADAWWERVTGQPQPQYGQDDPDPDD
ncbi:replication-associated recombination protein A [Microvirga sp. TS319]|uniref:replication-associated recombination protein A n=1 Tax=Microvirga sp. TS319 TaxID=3241165 RepID=UPI00351AA5B1